MTNKLFKNKNFLSVFLALIVFMIVYFINLDWANKNFQKSFNQEGYYDNRIVVVQIDENTTKMLNKRFPFDRIDYIPVIKNLKKAGATVIGIDIIFADQTSYDKEFAKAIKEAGNIVLGGGKIEEEDIRGLFERPLKIFTDSAKLIGSFNVIQNIHNNIVFSISPYQEFINGTYEYFGLSLLRIYYSNIFNEKSYLTIKQKNNNNILSIKDNIVIPYADKSNKEIIINYNNDIESISFYEIYNDKQFSIQQSIKGNLFLKDKIVLIGTTLRGLDVLKTPIGEQYGVYVHANFLNTVLTKNFSKYLDKNLELLLILLLSILAIYLNLSKSGKKLIFSNIGILVVLFLYFEVLKSLKFFLNYPIEIILSFLISIIFSNIAKYLIENKDKNKLNTALSEYVSKDIAEEILSGDGNINLDGDKKRIAIFFSDIEGFTNISERFTPEKLISFLKDYLTEMSEIIFLNKGFINKYEGDAIMALRGVFGKEDNISKSACETALLQKQKLSELNEKWSKDGIPQIKVRIGINSGEAIIGNIGSVGKKLEFTAIGDNVNLASRLESINKFYSTYICVSESVYEDTKNMFEYRYLDRIKVKGKDKAISVYELLGNKGTLDEKQKELYSNFEKGITLYLERDFKKSLTIFKKLSDLGDAPSLVYKERCITFIGNPPDENWDHTWTMTEK